MQGQRIRNINSAVSGSVLNVTWDASSVPEGEYYIMARVSDGLNVSENFSDVPVRVASNPFFNRSVDKRTACDLDGDGRTDTTVVRRDPNAGAVWYTRYSETGSQNVEGWGAFDADVFLDTILFQGQILNELH